MHDNAPWVTEHKQSGANSADLESPERQMYRLQKLLLKLPQARTCCVTDAIHYLHQSGVKYQLEH